MWLSLTLVAISLAVKRRPKLKSKYQDRVEKAIEYARTIESWEVLVDPRMLSFYCLGPDPSPYVLRNIDIEGKRVSIGFVSVNFPLSTFFFKCFPSCRDDD